MAVTAGMEPLPPARPAVGFNGLSWCTPLSLRSPETKLVRDYPLCLGSPFL